MEYDNMEMKNDQINNRLEELSTEANEIKYDIEEDRKKINYELEHSKEVENLINSIDIFDMKSLAYYGEQEATQVSKGLDAVLSQMNMSQEDRTNSMLNALQELMRKIDIKEITKENTIFEKIFNNIKDTINRILEKYNYVGREIEKIYVSLKLTEEDIKKSYDVLKQLFETSVSHYHNLVKYIIAAQKKLLDVEDEIAKKQSEYDKNKDNSLKLELDQLNNSYLVLNQRIMDLKMAENIAMQSIPTMNAQAFTNINLLRKINSSFIITIPIFKQQLAQAILIKKQKLQAQMLEKLDEKTNELIVNNAINTVEMAKKGVELTTSTTIKMDTLETTWKTIMDGIEETKKMQQEAISKSKEDSQKLEKIKNEFKEKFANY